MPEKFKIGDTWISEEGTEALIVNITEFEIWYEIKEFSFPQPCSKEVFFNSMRKKN